jgi:PIN domain nuclease of toxin-antitoxin system
MIAYLRGELGGQEVREILANPDHECLAHAINLCEVYYDFFRASGEAVAREALQDLEAVGISRRADISLEFCEKVGALKATQRRISLADCFALALAKLSSATVLTSDRHELAPIAEQGEYAIRFIR